MTMKMLVDGVNSALALRLSVCNPRQHSNGGPGQGGWGGGRRGGGGDVVGGILGGLVIGSILDGIFD